MVRFRKLIRQEIGAVLAEAEQPLYSGQIADRISYRPMARNMNYSVNIIAAVLRGAQGVEICYPSVARIGAARQYVMKDKNAYDNWVNKRKVTPLQERRRRKKEGV
jgi:hypothetical protein